MRSARCRAARGGESPGTLLTFGRDDVDFRRVNLGDRLWKTSDPVLEKRIRQTYTGEKPRFQRPIDLETTAARACR